MRLKSSLDWQKVSDELISSTYGIPWDSKRQSTSIIINLSKEVAKLGNEEINAKKTGHDRRLNEMLVKINADIVFLEEMILIERLST
jgi:hypothetical protein